MSIPIKGSRTEKNLAIAFAGESMARTRYTFFASKAKKQGFEQISAIFLETAENEREHGKIFLKFLKEANPEVHVQMTIPSYTIGTTLENLKYAAHGENEEWTKTYPHMADIAEEEGFTEIANKFRLIAQVEKEHEARFALLAQQVETGTVWKKTRVVQWKCRNCGYTTEAIEAPKECPVCGHTQSFMEIKEVLE
ncbi:rubrerythrin, putative [Trichomonas vaginalis G3]|uniref:Rubrerythrin, putative n=1 Tax=Trichomonas vaginalis (strain ATCC PRA-98 / G3) TaxID=412133 RepID=A2DB89_TRIV3|nr:rubrerythrin family [Trichomonas vaginalis G3]EAY22419.1 rubrerythrin, putative [Trichomonas vaginalis G3]KAI5517634.1 rubrerythrin family [Trichomonas vaginalis G3]|eukprot:XP_001583405.1 rubrerythrin [Trichomonas vaginalis G3]